MSFLGKLKNLFASTGQGGTTICAPSAQFETQVNAMAHIIAQITSDGWATFDVRDGARDMIVQVTPDAINTCTEEVDVATVARKIGLSATAQAIDIERLNNHDNTMHRLPDASPREIAEVVNGIFLHHYGLPSNYRVECSLET